MIYSCLTWPIFGSWNEPIEEERPPAYIIMLGDTTLPTTIGIDAGIAAQTILLGAAERGLGGCIFGSVAREPIQQGLKIPKQYRLLIVIAIGKPKEQVVIEPPGLDGNLNIWRDENWVHHVPKRTLSEVILDL